MEISEVDCGNLYNLAIATTKAENPAAEEANPAAVGKLFSETICKPQLDILGKDESDCSNS